jgi:hypothetical protein
VAVAVFLLPFVLLAIVAVLIYLPPVQNALREHARTYLERKIGTPVRLEGLSLRFPIGVGIHGLYVEDRHGDTLLYAGALKTRVGLMGLFKRRISLSSVDLSDVRGTVKQDADSVFNFDYIVKAFTGDKAAAPQPADADRGWDFSIGAISLERIALDIDLKPSRMDMAVRLGELDMDLDVFDPAAMRFHVDGLALSRAIVDLRMASGPPEPDTYPDLVNPFAGLDVRFSKIALDDVRFTLKEVVKGDSLWIDLPMAEIKADAMDLSKQSLALKYVKLSNPDLGMLGPTERDLPDTAKVDPPWLDRHDGFRYYARDMQLTAKEIELEGGTFAVYRDSIASPHTLFDPQALMLSSADLDLQDVVFGNDSIAVSVKALEFRNGPDNERFSLTTNISATPATTALKNGTLEFDGNKLDLSVVATPHDLSTAYRSPDQVPLCVYLRTSLDPETLRPLLARFGLEHFLPKGITERFQTSLTIAGSVAQLDSARFSVDGDQGSVIHLRAKGKDLGQWPAGELKVDVDKFTLGTGFRQVMQAVLPSGTVLPRWIGASAHAQLHEGALRASLDIESDAGRIKGSASASGMDGRIPDNVAADLMITGLRPDHFMGDTTIGPMSFAVTVKGADLNSASRSGTLELRPSELHYNGIDLSSLAINGAVRGDSIFVSGSSDARALKFALDARGKWPGSGDSLALAFSVKVDSADLGRLGAMPQRLDLQGMFAGRAAFDTTGLGRFAVNADGLRLSNGKRAFRFERFDIAGRLGADSSALRLNSDAVTLAYRTNVAVDSILPRTKAKIASYFKADSAFRPSPGKYMDLAITLPKSDWLAGLVVPELHAITLKTFTGHYDSDADMLKLTVDIPDLLYDSIAVTALSLNVDAKGNSLTSKLSVERATYDQLSIDGLSLTSTTKAGVLGNTLRVQHGDEPPSYQLSVQLSREGEGDAWHMVPEGLVLDRTIWTADPKNLLRFTAAGVQAEHFDLRSDDQRIQVVTGDRATRIDLAGFRIGTLLNFVSSKDSTAFAAGTLSGTVDLPKNGVAGLKVDLNVNDLAVMGNRLGDLSIDADEASKAHYDADVTLKSGANTLAGHVVVDASGSIPAIHGKADISFTDLNVFKPFTKSFLYELAGGLDGHLKYDNVQGRGILNGDLDFTDASLGILATRSLFRLDKESLHFDDQGIHLKHFTMKDSLDHVFTLNGDIFTTDPGDPRFDLSLRTDSFQLVGSRRGDNDLFYGDVLAGLDLTITGTGRLPKLSGEVEVLSGTDLSVVMPGSEVKLVSSEGIVVFTDNLDKLDSIKEAKNGMMLRDSINAQLEGYELDLKIRVDNDARFSVVLDPTTGDAASFQGEGDLHFNHNARGDMTLTGPFTFASGDYTLEFYGLVKKHFELVKGSTVTWTGDPLKARLAIKARYRSETAPYALVAGSEVLSQDETNRLQERLPFDVIISVDGRIDKPVIDLGIDLDRQYRNSYPQVASRLDELSQSANVDDRNRQVFGLLVMNSFIPEESASTAPSSGIVTSAARSSVNGLLTDQLNKVTGKYVKGVDVSLGVSTVDQVEGNGTYQRTSVDYKVSKSFLNDRLSFEVGGSVGVDEQDQEVGNISNTRAAQYVVYYNLTPDGKYRLRGFYENAFDLYDGDITDSGVAIQYTKEFEENERARTAAREAERRRRAQEEAQKAKQHDARDSISPSTPPNEEEQ